MSIWCTVKNLEQGVQKMKTFYDQKGMFEIRIKYATWIEERLSRENSNISEEAAFQFYKDLAEFIRISAQSEYDYSVISNRMRQIPPMEFYTHLTEGVARELLLIGEITPNSQMYQLELLQGLIKSCDEFYQIPNILFDTGMNPTISESYDHVEYLSRMFNEYEALQSSVLQELKNWQRQQIQIGNDVHQHDSVNQIQSCVELLVEVSFRMLQLVDSVRMRSQNLPDERLEKLAQQIKIQQENLIVNSFIVQNQPPQVIKTCTNFTASVRWLIGPQLGLNKSISNVECIVVSETQAKRLYRERQMSKDLESSSKGIRGNKVTMEYQEQSRLYSANFKNLLIKKIQRGERRGSSESVMDEKLALLFYLTVTVNGSCFNVWTLSLPVVVIVHGSQEHQAWATILWDNAFSEIGREPFKVPDRVTWAKLLKTLYSKCVSLTDRGFTKENEYLLYEKLFQNGNMIMTMMNPEAEISWTKFCKDDLFNYSFTFWDWFYHTIKLIKERLLEPWNANLIEGFINKKITEEKLKMYKPGTFLLRFSDSVRGAITISFVNENREIEHIQPWDSKDLQNRCLADRIKDLVVLTELYPNAINKFEAFEKFCSKKSDQKIKDGYVPGIPITTIVKDPSTKTTPTHNMFPENSSDTSANTSTMDLYLENSFDADMVIGYDSTPEESYYLTDYSGFVESVS